MPVPKSSVAPRLPSTARPDPHPLVLATLAAFDDAQALRAEATPPPPPLPATGV